MTAVIVCEACHTDDCRSCTRPGGTRLTAEDVRTPTCCCGRWFQPDRGLLSDLATELDVEQTTEPWQPHPPVDVLRAFADLRRDVEAVTVEDADSIREAWCERDEILEPDIAPPLGAVEVPDWIESDPGVWTRDNVMFRSDDGAVHIRQMQVVDRHGCALEPPDLFICGHEFVSKTLDDAHQLAAALSDAAGALARICGGAS